MSAAQSELVTLEPRGSSSRFLSAGDIRANVNLIQEVMKAVMIGPSKENPDGVHYGTIPGCKKPSLYKAGSEVLLSTFRIAVSVHVDDLSTDDCVRYRVRVTGTHQGTGVVVGEGVGECSSNEAKYKWKRCYLQQEFDAMPPNRRRITYFKPKDSSKVYENMEVRTEPADVANTILKMAKKRAQIDMTLTATAASDIFTQDIEDLPEDLRDNHGDAGHGPRQSDKKAPAGNSLPGYPEDNFTKNLPAWTKLIASSKKTPAQIIATIESKAALSDAQRKTILNIKSVNQNGNS